MQTIDCTPTWAGLLPLMLELHEGRNIIPKKRAETRKTIRDEFNRMAKAADQWNEHVKTLQAAAQTTEK